MKIRNKIEITVYFENGYVNNWYGNSATVVALATVKVIIILVFNLYLLLDTVPATKYGTGYEIRYRLRKYGTGYSLLLTLNTVQNSE